MASSSTTSSTQPGLTAWLVTLRLHPAAGSPAHQQQQEQQQEQQQQRPSLSPGQERRFAAALASVDDEMVARGGPTGGWGAREHAVFLKLWAAFRASRDGEGDPVARVTGNLRLLDRALVALRGKRCVCAGRRGWRLGCGWLVGSCIEETLPSPPTTTKKCSEAEVMRHIEWYEGHQELLRKKEELAAAWRAARGAVAVLAAAEGGPEGATKKGAAPQGKAVAQQQQQQQEEGETQVDPKRARVQRQLRAWRLRRAAEAARAEAAERARRARAREEERAAEQRYAEAVRRRLERQRAARAVVLREKAAAAAVPEEKGEGPSRIPAVVLERRALKAVKDAKARWAALRRREEARDPAQRGRRQRALLAGWRQAAAWRMEEEPEAVERRYAEAAAAAATLQPDPHCARRHARGVGDSVGLEAEEKQNPPAQPQPQPKPKPKPSVVPRPFLDLQFRDAARLTRPTVAWATRAHTDEDLVALDRRRNAGAHFQARHPAFPPAAAVC